MKRAELLTHAKCTHCHRQIGHTGLPLFWKVTIERFGVDMNAVKRQDGLGAFLGSQALGAVMGPDEDLAKPMMDRAELTLCEECAMSSIPAAVLADIASHRDEAKRREHQAGKEADEDRYEDPSAIFGDPRA
jgi:hypothetical protein